MTLLSKLIQRFREGLYLKTSFYNLGIGFNVAHISDLHYDNTGKFPLWVQAPIKNKLMDYAVQILCVTGDIVDKDPEFIKPAFDWLHSLPVNYIIISPGNHDKYSIDTIIELLPQYPKIKFFINNNFVYQHLNFICSADRGDKTYYSQFIQRFDSLYDSNLLNVVLSHNPNSFLDLDYTHPFIMLSGHTHGGQVCHADFLRSIFKRFINERKVLCALRINHEHDCFKLQGKYIKNNNTLFINNGLGTHPPGRLFCPPMLTIYK